LLVVGIGGFVVTPMFMQLFEVNDQIGQRSAKT
jgi:hypothetical protein